MTENGVIARVSAFPRPHRIFNVLLSAWLLFPVTVIVFLAILGLERANHEFEEHTHRLFDEVSARLRDNQAALNGFSAFLAVADRQQRNEVIHYAASVLRDNPHIYALEVVEEVAAAELPRFVREMRNAGYERFTIRDFDYEGTRRWLEAEPRDVYYPLSIVVSLHNGLDELLGLDIGQVSFLNQTLASALKTPGISASRPFDLYEGDEGYALVSRVTPPTAKYAKKTARTVAVLIVRIHDLLPVATLPQGYPFRISLSAAVGAEGEKSVQLLEHSAPQGSWLTRHVLPKLRFEQRVEESIPPITMVAERQLEWRDINLAVIALVSLASIITFALLQVYARAHRRSEQRRTELEALLHYKAHYDDLTGLPNRTLIIDRMEQGLRNAQRDHQSMAVLFLDLDGFKPINDTYGHKAGDEVLREVAQRLRTVVRERDTVGRLSGDEFIMVLMDTDREGAGVVSEKIAGVFEAPFDIGIGERLQIGISAGIAVYSEDGETVTELMRIADADMYRHKATHYR